MEERGSSRSSQASEQGQKFDVFLSHSGKQKDFIKQLHSDLTNQGLSCFFDQDRDCLPLAQPFPPRIFEAINKCQIAVILLSHDFLGSKWPMLELSAFVEARDKKCTNPNLKILPLFFLISPDALKNTDKNDEKWQMLEISQEERGKWQEALKAIRPINGLLFQGGDELEFRNEIVKEIWNMIDSTRYHVRGMQGQARMCQEVTNFFKKVQPRKGGVRIVGLYGIAGHGKTTLGKAVCNFCLGEFEGKVCHLEFGRGNSLERAKLALQHLTHRSQLYVQTLINEDQAKVELYRRVEGKRVLLVLDNITEESMDEVRDYLQANFGGNSWILLSARSGEFLEKYFQIDRQAGMHVPRLKEEEAVTILLERAFPLESTLKEEDTGFALQCAKRCLFKEVSCVNAPRAPIFHPLALKAYGGYLLGKYGLNLPKWVGDIDAMVDRHSDSLDEVFDVLGKAFDEMPTKYQTIFMLLTVYILPNMSLDKVIEWMALNCNENIPFIKKALQVLRLKAFIEEFEPEIHIHDLNIEFAQMKANKMERWLWWKKEDDICSTRGLISQNNAGFELAKLEQCRYRRVNPKYIGNLFVLQLIEVENMSKLELGPMSSLRSITLCDCKLLAAVEGIENLVDLQWLQITGLHPMFKLPELSTLEGLQYLHIDIAGSQAVYLLGNLSNCYRLREIYVLCPSLIEFPRLKNMKHLEKVEFRLCNKVKGPLDCRDCVKLQTVVLSSCCQMAASPLLDGCEKLETLELWNMGELMELPSFERLSNLTVLKLVKCGIREPPDLTACKRLQNVYFFSLRNLKRFPNFSSLSNLKKLIICNCIRVKDPPDIGGCNNSQVFYPPYKDNIMVSKQMDFWTTRREYQDELGDENVTFSASEKLYDAFIHHQLGPDVKGTHVPSALYHSLEEKGFCTILEDQELQLEDVICFSKVHIVIFSPHYAESPWCLTELVSILKTKALFIPVFCDIWPYELRKIHRGVYAPAFAQYEEMGIFYDRLDEWKAALYSCTSISGYVFSTSNGNVEELCAKIVLAVQKVVRKTSSETVASYDKKIELSEENVMYSPSNQQKKVYDIFINYRADVKKTLASALYYSLREKGFWTFLDDQELELGDVIHSVIYDAIYSSTVQITIFSPRFAESHWCLDELVSMLKTNTFFIPVFCDVKPSDLQFLDKGPYAPALARHEENGILNDRLAQWKQALHSCSVIPGYEFSTSTDNLEKLCSDISKAVEKVAGKTSTGFRR